MKNQKRLSPHYECKGIKVFPRLDLLKSYTTIGHPKNSLIRDYPICIFCGGDLRSNNKTHSHLIPELFGKNSSINNYECDSCNKLSGKWESSLGTFLTPLRIISGIKNKKGKIPKFKSRLDGFSFLTEIFQDSNKKLTAKLATYNDYQIQEDGSGKLIFRLGSVNPFHIYKVFLKIALSLMPDEILNKEDWMKEYLFKEEVDKHIFPYIFQIFTNKIIFPSPVFELKTLTAPRKFHPKYLLIAYFGKTVIEFILPIKKIRNRIVLNMPPVLEIQSPRPVYSIEKIDLSSNNNTKMDMYFDFQKK